MSREHRRTPGRSQRLAVIAGTSALLLSGCSAEELKLGYLPTERGLTDKVNSVIDLWNGSWIGALAVGVFVWILMIVAMVVFRRRHADDPLPKQMAYNVPLEVVYTVAPILAIAVMFNYNTKSVNLMENSPEEPEVRIQAVGKQWAWDFNYLDEDVYETTTQLDIDQARDLEEGELPTLYLPVNKTVEITLNSRDVIHSFWVPAFLYKKDMIPGVTNTWKFKPQKEGTYAGKCAELCGQYHASMLFQVKVVSDSEYDKQMSALRDKGQTGALTLEVSRKSQAELVADEASKETAE